MSLCDFGGICVTLSHMFMTSKATKITLLFATRGGLTRWKCRHNFMLEQVTKLPVLHKHNLCRATHYSHYAPLKVALFGTIKLP